MHPSVRGEYGQLPLREAVLQARQETFLMTDQEKRDAWLTSRASSNVLVGEGVTLSDVQRWLREAVQ